MYTLCYCINSTATQPNRCVATVCSNVCSNDEWIANTPTFLSSHFLLGYRISTSKYSPVQCKSFAERFYFSAGMRNTISEIESLKISFILLISALISVFSLAWLMSLVCVIFSWLIINWISYFTRHGRHISTAKKYRWKNRSSCQLKLAIHNQMLASFWLLYGILIISCMIFIWSQ